MTTEDQHSLSVDTIEEFILLEIGLGIAIAFIMLMCYFLNIVLSILNLSHEFPLTLLLASYHYLGIAMFIALSIYLHYDSIKKWLGTEGISPVDDNGMKDSIGNFESDQIISGRNEQNSPKIPTVDALNVMIVDPDNK